MFKRPTYAYVPEKYLLFVTKFCEQVFTAHPRTLYKPLKSDAPHFVYVFA